MAGIQCFRFAKSGSQGRDGKPLYMYVRRSESGWMIVSQAGVREAWSNFATDGEYLRLVCDRCASAELASEYFTDLTGYETEVI